METVTRSEIFAKIFRGSRWYLDQEGLGHRFSARGHRIGFRRRWNQNRAIERRAAWVHEPGRRRQELSRAREWAEWLRTGSYNLCPRMYSSRSSRLNRMALEMRQWRIFPASMSLYTVAVESRRRLAASRTLRSASGKGIPRTQFRTTGAPRGVRTGASGANASKRLRSARSVFSGTCEEEPPDANPSREP